MSTYLEISSVDKKDFTPTAKINTITDEVNEVLGFDLCNYLDLHNSFEARCIVAKLVDEICLVTDGLFIDKDFCIKFLEKSKVHPGWELIESDINAKKELEESLTKIIDQFNFETDHLFIHVG